MGYDTCPACNVNIWTMNKQMSHNIGKREKTFRNEATGWRSQELIRPPSHTCIVHRRSRITSLKRDHSFSGSLRVNNNKNNNNNNNNMSDAINDAELQEVSVCKFVNKYSFKRVSIVHGFFRGIIFFFKFCRPKLDPFQAKGRGKGAFYNSLFG